MVATGYANPNVKAVDLRTTLRVALRAHSLSNNRPERNENCVTYVAGLKCYPCWRLHKSVKPLRGESRDVSAVPVKPVCILSTFSTRRCGRSRRPAFPAPSVRERDNEFANSGEITPRECRCMIPQVA